MPTTSYWIDVRHEGLHAYRRITGRDRYVVEAKAADVQQALKKIRLRKLFNLLLQIKVTQPGL